jgi:predicted kinase
MACAHLIYGFIGSGKTTFARRLEAQQPVLRFSFDEWMVQLYGTNPPKELFHDYWIRVNHLITHQWSRALTLGIDVVLDEGLWHRRRRDQVRTLVTSLGADFKLYHVQCSESTMRTRTLLRNENLTDSFYIDEAAFDELIKSVDPLGDDEEHEIVVTEL